MKWLGYFWCGLTLLAVLSARSNPVEFGYFSLLGTAMPYLLIGLFFIIFAWRKTWLVLIPVGCLLISWTHFSAFIGWHIFPEKSTKNSIRVLTWNIGELWSSKEKRDEITRHQRDFFNFIKKTAQPDIFCTQEIGGEFIPTIARETGLSYFCQVVGRQTAIFSKFPIEKSGEIPFAKTANSAIWADIKLPSGKTIRVFCAHLQSNKVSADADKVAENGKIDDKETWDEVGGIFSKVNRGTQKRSRQARILAENIENSPNPAILCGDLNDTPHSFTYHLLTQNLIDPFRLHGFGLGTTYRGSIPLLRIDYILTAEKIPTLDYRTLDGQLSDHNPVFCEINF
jgi:endonuclease/exonuclease/phosphatase (EEP) superfamily protein YafD